MSTLTTKDGIVWNVMRHNGNCAFVCGPHSICFENRTKLFHLKEMGETIFVGKKSYDCLEVAAEFIWEYHANQFVPMWEQ